MRRVLAFLFIFASPLLSQSTSGELRLKVTDPAGLGVEASVLIVSEANQYRNTLTTNDDGTLDVQRLPFGIYQLEINRPGFAAVAESIEIRSSFPLDHTLPLKVSPVD